MRNNFAETGKQHKSLTAVSTSATIVGFILFLTGALLLVVGVVDIVAQLENLWKVAYLVGGLLLYKTGVSILRHHATLRTPPERRRHLHI